ncbi:hypothetical protein NLJ89_g2933 [Agrocybe chaxingu]|uniref:Aminoglycoside phosphotransferase domain-containing protein n=1 Tax=Agrocybe chaxingu TaxID=84603 RepID=A0A9W8K5V9_9AGAR|nr:hypothetical protein NLJ89_g2933 [Agrocybe chaxingu]
METPSDRSCEHEDPRLQHTMGIVNWDALAAVACGDSQAQSFTWGELINGGYNVVRFLKINNGMDTEVVVRVPYQPLGLTDVAAETLGHRIASEVASMQYVSLHTQIPVPRVIAHNTERDGGGVGCPYMVMSKGEGIPLVMVWNDMDDTKREAILRQVVEILLQLSSLRFDSIGALFKRDTASGPEWYIAPSAKILSDEVFTYSPEGMARTFTNAFDYWIAYASRNMQRVDAKHFGCMKSLNYSLAWLHRSLIPSIYDTSLDAKGFPLIHGDFHLQNIMVIDTDTPSPRITAIVDWEFTSTVPTSSFAQYPFFIIDHPIWEDDHPLKPRNVRDQATFVRLMREAEGKTDVGGSLPLSHAFETCQGVYLFKQSVVDPFFIGPQLHTPLFKHFFGKTDTEAAYNYAFDLESSLTSGILKNKMEQLKHETAARTEAVDVLGDELITKQLTRSQFRAIIDQHLDKFAIGGEVNRWIAANYNIID